MSLSDQINQGLKAAMKAKDDVRKRTLRAIKSEILLLKTDGTGAEITEEKEIKLLQKMAKQREDSLSTFEQQGRDELAQKEREELVIIKEFLPKQMDPAELEAAIKAIIEKVGASSMKDMGKVMGMASKEFAGKADGKTISTLVRQLLS
ncbi:MAG: GatB/YqeY domain-containing protein [Aureispira sp.]|nr:GatB/YqeY domain-containing protein [Aureispira sp.]